MHFSVSVNCISQILRQIGRGPLARPPARSRLSPSAEGRFSPKSGAPPPAPSRPMCSAIFGRKITIFTIDHDHDITFTIDHPIIISFLLSISGAPPPAPSRPMGSAIFGCKIGKHGENCLKSVSFRLYNLWRLF